MSSLKQNLRLPHDPSRRRLLQGIGAALLPWPLHAGEGLRGSTVVETTLGRVQGVVEGPASVFRGIPYGADTATTRFRRPEPAAPWTGIRDVVDYAARCPQDERSLRGPRKLLASWIIPQAQSEDCLFLNVWTPRPGDSAKRPVMVWIHGGGFVNGSGATTVYEGHRLAEKGDVVVVTLNHRLNVFGHLCLAEFSDEFADSANVGQHDLVLALQWIRDNIAEFGGDPGNVTVFGESGGGAKISVLLAMEEAQGLFHRAVIQSGPMLWAARAEPATETARLALDALGAAPDKLRRLDTATTDELLQALAHIKANGRFRTLAPVIDGRGLARDPFVPDAPSMSRDVPVMIGMTATESTLLLGGDETLFELDWAALPERLAEFTGDVEPAGIVREYREAFPGWSASDVFFDVTTMYLVGRNAMRIADLRSVPDAAPTFFYEVDFRLALDGGKWRAPHAMDIPLVFDNVANSSSMFVGSSGMQDVADVMRDAWIAFARTGKPDTGKSPDWPQWDASRHTMMFDTTSRVAAAPRGRRAEILRDIPYWDLTKPNRL